MHLIRDLENELTVEKCVLMLQAVFNGNKNNGGEEDIVDDFVDEHF